MRNETAVYVAPVPRRICRVLARVMSVLRLCEADTKKVKSAQDPVTSADAITVPGNRRETHYIRLMITGTIIWYLVTI